MAAAISTIHAPAITMASALNSLPVLRACAFRPRATILRPQNAVIGVKRPAYRSFADDKSNQLPEAEEGDKGPNMDQAAHVSKEAAKMAKIQGGQGPDIEGQGTAVQDILKNEKDTRQNAPQVMQEEAKKGKDGPKPGTRPFSTLARRQVELTPASESSEPLDSSMLPTAAEQADHDAELDASSNLPVPQQGGEGHKFPLPELPLAQGLNKDYRYDPVVQQITNLIMQDGKKAAAQRNMATILNILRTTPAPTYSPTRPLLPGAPPASHLPLNPTLYLTLAVDSVAPLLRIRSQKGAAGGGVALQIPVPLGLRQRRRTAFEWILDAAVKRKSRGSGNDMFATKVADELIAIVEGKSTVWEKRLGVHKLATTARANLSYGIRGRR
ncbi:37S ribosomal protein S7, mitochondrial [Fulvia fulva]|nr:37S ribosomal protein S7, mitochondrial [Fulvia fulva]